MEKEVAALEQRIKLIVFLRKMAPNKFKNPKDIEWEPLRLAQRNFSKL